MARVCTAQLWLRGGGLQPFEGQVETICQRLVWAPYSWWTLAYSSMVSFQQDTRVLSRAIWPSLTCLIRREVVTVPLGGGLLPPPPPLTRLIRVPLSLMPSSCGAVASVGSKVTTLTHAQLRSSYCYVFVCVYVSSIFNARSNMVIQVPRKNNYLCVT